MDGTDKTVAALDSAVGNCGIAVIADIGGRMGRARDPMLPPALMERAGIRRSLWSYLEQSIQVERPDWPRVRALHKAWVISDAWCREGEAVQKAGAK